jgi:DNA-binding NarL/FixJ family response regulator
MDTIRVLVADEHDGVRAGLVTLLSTDGSGIEVAGEGRSGMEAIQCCRLLSPDVLLLDLNLPDFDGSEVARQLQQDKSPTRVLVVSAFFGRTNRKSIAELFECGVAGCITKDEAIEWLIAAVQGVAKGERWLSPMLKNYLP